MEKYKDIYGMYVAFDPDKDDYKGYMHLKSSLETELKQAVKVIKQHNHKGFDVSLILFNDDTAVLTCCVDEQELWIGLYYKNRGVIQRYVVYDDVKMLTDAEISRFARIIENIAKNPKRLINEENLAKAWQEELNRINKGDIE